MCVCAWLSDSGLRFQPKGCEFDSYLGFVVVSLSDSLYSTCSSTNIAVNRT